MKYIHFSPDGRYALAQDAAAIHVFSVSPFLALFDIVAPDAGRPHFSPDGAFLSFVSESLRCEKWDIAKRRQASVHELQIRQRCIVYSLSPTGDLFACLQTDLTLNISRVESGEVIFERSTADYSEASGGVYRLPPSGIEQMSSFLMEFPPEIAFSPGESWFLLTRLGLPSQTVLVDLHAKKAIRLSSWAVGNLANSFVFLSEDQVLVREWSKKGSAVIQLPGAEIKERLVVPPGEMIPLSDSHYVLIENAGKWASIVVNLSEKAVILGSLAPALDIWQDLRLVEGGAGQLLLKRGKTDVGAVVLTRPLLGGITAAAFSPSLDRIALSNSVRAVLWDTQTGTGD
jgi:WD40 repeat protein